MKVNSNLLKMPTIPSYIPQGDVSYIKPQYANTSLNRNMIFPGVPQSLPAPPPLPQLPAPPPLPQLPAPPPLLQLPAPPPVNISFDNMFGNMLENVLMPREYGFKPQSYLADLIDEDVMDALPQPQQDKYIENKIAPQIENQMKDITFDNEEQKAKARSDAIAIKTAKEWGTKHANKLHPFDQKYKDNEHYKNNYVSRLQDIINQDSLNLRGGIKKNTQENKDKAIELLKAIGIKPPLKPTNPQPTPAPTPSPTQPSPPKRAPSPQPAAKTAPTKQPSPPPAAKAPPAAKSGPPLPPPPPPPGSLLAPPPPPPPAAAPAKAMNLSLLEDTPEEKQRKIAEAEKLKQSAAKGDIKDAIKEQAEKASKQAGTKDARTLSSWKDKYIDNFNYRKNYIKELELIANDETNDKKERLKNYYKILMTS
jgi:hypothetical protein